MTPSEEATREKRSASAKRAAKKRAATKKAERAARRKETRETPLVLADIDKLRSSISKLSDHISRIDHRVGRLHLDVATLSGHCLIDPQTAGALVKELLDRLSVGELEKLGVRLPLTPSGAR